MENQPQPAEPFYISEADALQLMRAALLSHGHLLPSWQPANEETAEAGAIMLFYGGVGDLLFVMGREFARALVPLLEQAQAYELAAGMQSAIRLGSCITDDEGLRGVYLDHMGTNTTSEVYPMKPGPAEPKE
jgi:hypothetical protein